MNHIEFLKVCFEKYGQSDDLANGLTVGEWIASRRSSQPSSPIDIQDPLLVLLSDYSITDLEFGTLSFDHPVVFPNGRIKVGREGGCPIYRLPESNMIVQVDGCKPDFVVCRCAKDGSSFLTALANYLRCGYEWGFDEDDVSKIVESAGGPEYDSFWRDLTCVW